MVATQIRARGVTNEAVLDAMTRVPRHLFVPDDEQPNAYDDSPLAIGFGQTISQPFIVAYMTDALNVRSGLRVLEIGTGCGYQAAVLAELGCEVFSLEVVAELADRARLTLQRLGYTNVRVRNGDGYAGWPEAAPFDRVILTAAPVVLPATLVDQLDRNGRLVAPVGSFPDQAIAIVTKVEGRVVTEEDIPVRFVPMVGAGRC